MTMPSIIPAGPAQEQDLEQHILKVKGSGVVEHSMDVAIVSLEVACEAATATIAQQKNAALLAKVRTALMGIGLTEQDIHVRDYSVVPTGVTDKRDGPSVGYEISNTLVVNTERLDLVSSIIDVALDSGASRLRSLDFSVKDKRWLRGEALKSATENAQSQAEIVAKTLGAKVIGPNRVEIRVEEENVDAYDGIVYFGTPCASGRALSPIVPGTLAISATVNITFRLEP